MAYFSLDLFEFDEDDWWDSYYDYQDEKDAFWVAHYSKVHYTLPDSRYIRKLQLYHYRSRSNVLSPEEFINYERLHNVIIKIDSLFVLWQKRLSHEWNKDVKRPSEKLKEKVTAEPSTEKKKAVAEKDESQANAPNMCPQLERAVAMIEEECRIFDHVHDFFSEYEDDDDDDDDDDDGSIGYMDSDDWESSIDDELYSFSDEEFYEHELRRRVRQRKQKKEAARNDSIRQYKLSAEKFYAAFPSDEDASVALRNLSLIKSWIINICTCKLTKYIGQWLPDLVMEKILRYLRDNYKGELQMKISIIAKTAKFIDVEKLRMRELYAALQDIHSLLFEIMFKTHCTSSTSYLKQYFNKLVDVAIRKMTLLDDLHTWLLGGQDEDTSEVRNNNFMSGICYKKLIKEPTKDFDYFMHLNDGFSCLDGNNMAILIPSGIKEGFVRIYNVITGSCVLTHKIDKLGVILGMALHNNHLALVLKEDSVPRLDVYDVEKQTALLVSYKIWSSMKDTVEKLFFADVCGSESLVIQQKESVAVISLGKDHISPKFTKEYEKMNVLAVKGHYMIAKDAETHDHAPGISSAKEVSEISQKIIGIKVFDLNKNSLIQVIEHPKIEKNQPYYFGAMPKWSVAVDTNVNSRRFILWNNQRVQLWDLDDGAKKLQDIDLGKRLSGSTKLTLNKNVILIQNSQSSHDSNYDSIDLAEFLFYDIDTSKVCYFETFHHLWESPDSNIASPGGPFFARHMSDDVVVLLHSSSNVGEIRVYQFNLDAKKIINLQVAELLVKRREEENIKLLKEAEKKRQNEERMKRREEQRQKRLQMKQMKKIEKRNKKPTKMDEIRRMERSGICVEGVITDWRGTYGFMQVPNIGSVFIHKSDITGKPFVKFGSRIQCQLQEQTLHSRPKAVLATMI